MPIGEETQIFFTFGAGSDSRALRLLLPLIYFTYYIKERSICYD